MAKIDAKMVKELRERTGAGMMDCKKALTETDGDMDKAIDYLREKGIAKAEKKAGRIASEGVVAAYVADDAKVAALVEINCETDFVAVTEKFHALCDKIAKHIAETNPTDLDALNASTLEGKTVAEIVTEAVASIGEKISLRRFERYENASGRIASYIHMGGKIGVLVDLSGGTAEIGKDIAMQQLSYYKSQPLIWAATSAAKSSDFFSKPSPSSKRTKRSTATSPRTSLTVLSGSLTNGCSSRQTSW